MSEDYEADTSDWCDTHSTTRFLCGCFEAESAPVSPAAPLAPVSPGHPERTGAPVETGRILDEIRAWLFRFIITLYPGDLDVLTLWAAHTHLVIETYTSPRLVLDSPVPGSGKTTTLEHLERLCLHAVQMASLSSPALLTRMLDAGMRSILIDEADRSLNPDKEGVAELLAVLNSGYKRGGTRPVLIPTKDGWRVAEHPTYSPVAMAGNNPNLPEDTKSRTIRVLLMPDVDGVAEESDWELLDEPARALGARLAAWADQVRDAVRTNRPPLPAGVIGRGRERWSPLKRVAVAAGGRWPAVVDELALADLERLTSEREEGIVQQRPTVVLLGHVHQVWPAGETFVSTENIIRRLIDHDPDTWGADSRFGKPLTAQRLGRMLTSSYGIHSTRLDRTGPRGYTVRSFEQTWRRMGVTRPAEPDRAGSQTPPGETGAAGASGETGAPGEENSSPDGTDGTDGTGQTDGVGTKSVRLRRP